jgi:hypothetical protein
LPRRLLRLMMSAPAERGVELRRDGVGTWIGVIEIAIDAGIGMGRDDVMITMTTETMAGGEEIESMAEIRGIRGLGLMSIRDGGFRTGKTGAGHGRGEEMERGTETEREDTIMIMTTTSVIGIGIGKGGIEKPILVWMEEGILLLDLDVNT